MLLKRALEFVLLQLGRELLDTLQVSQSAVGDGLDHDRLVCHDASAIVVFVYASAIARNLFNVQNLISLGLALVVCSSFALRSLVVQEVLERLLHLLVLVLLNLNHRSGCRTQLGVAQVSHDQNRVHLTLTLVSEVEEVRVRGFLLHS